MQTGRKLVKTPFFLLSTGFILVAVIASVYCWWRKSNSDRDAIVHVEKSQYCILSEIVGYEFWSQLKEWQKYYSLEDVIKGMRVCEAGLPLPQNINPEIRQQLINDMETAIFEDIARNNVKKAEEFLLAVSKLPNIVACEENYLYYEILCEGHETKEVLENDAGVFHYTILTLDGEKISDTRENNMPRQLNLADLITGFSKGVVGMKQGERRKIYVHPNFAYRKTGWHVPPQSLIIIDVEVISFTNL